MKIDTLRWSLPLIVGSVVPLFFLSIYLGSCWSRLRQWRERCKARYSELEAALRLRLQTGVAVARLMRERSPSYAAQFDDYFQQAAELEQLLSTPGSRWPAQVERVRRAALFLEQSMPGLDDLAGGEIESVVRPFRVSSTSLAEAVAAYGQTCGQYASALRRFPESLLARLGRLSSAPGWPN